MVALAAATTTTAAVAAAAGSGGEICVIGAGAAGLVTAKYLLARGFRPTILEAADGLGGLWQSSNGKTWKSLRTNLSHYTCCFSDYPWSRAFPHQMKKESGAALASFFPTNQQMHEYLKAYSQHFLEDRPSCCRFQFGCQVTKVIPSPENHHRYLVSWRTAEGQPNNSGDDDSAQGQQQQQEQQKVFDGVVVASGFFSKPAWPRDKGDVVDLSNFAGRHLHSSQYQSVDASLLSQDSAEAAGVAVCGSSFSAMEIAVDLAKSSERPVYNICTSPLPWIVPRFLPHNNNNGASSFIPIDLAFYRRPKDGLKQPEQVLATDGAVNQQKHEYLEKLLGRRKQAQTTISTTSNNHRISQPYDDPTLPVFASVSDDYLDLVQSGRIQLIPGRLVGCDAETGRLCVETPPAAAHKEEAEATTVLLLSDNITTLISATGYTPHLQAFLDEDQILRVLDYQPHNPLAPLILCDDVHHPALPNLAFCGMYRGPYFGVLELQARLAVQTLVQQQRQPATTADDEEAEEDQALLEVSRQIREQSPRPQFPRGDLIGRMDALANRLRRMGERRNDDEEEEDAAAMPHYTQKGDVVLPVMYQPDATLAHAVVQEMEEDVRCLCQTPQHVTPLLLSSLHGKWKFHRTLTQLKDGSQQTVSGVVDFSSKRLPAGEQEDPGSTKGDDAREYTLYREDGTMALPNGKPIEVFREYHYTVNPNTGALEIFFVEGGQRAHLFLSLLFRQPDEAAKDVWEATSDHLCIQDLYDADFRIELDGLAAKRVQMKYTVKGPAKDYQAVTTLTPDTP